MTAIEFVKSQEQEEDLIFVMDDRMVQKVMWAWTKYTFPEPPKFKLTAQKNETIAHVLSEMWEKIQVDFEVLTRIAGVPYQVVVESFDRLKAARLIYPDGTIPVSAQKLIRSEVSGYKLGLIPKGMKLPMRK